MECPHLETGRTVNVCDASLTLMTPSVYETNIYCTTDEHYRCPILLAHELRGGFREHTERAGMLLTQIPI